MSKQAVKISILILFLVMVASPAGTPARAAAFHSGGAADCGGCHLTHAAGGTTPSPSGSLLRGSDPSSICLNCHSGPGGPASPSVLSFDGSALSPGGDFYWLTRTFTWIGGSSPGASHGHNVVARDYNLVADPIRPLAPGGTFPSAELSCISCHDPHGRIGGTTALPPVAISGSYGQPAAPGASTGRYRLLGGAGYQAARGYTFTADPPVARQNPLRPFGETDASHVDYGSGMSAWCGNCHSAILTGNHAGSGSFRHPAGSTARFSTAAIDSYNAYIRTGDLSGLAETAYLQFVPFERGASDPLLLDPTSTRGPDANANLMCLSCHRAHASAFPFAGRWDFSAQRLTESHPAPGDGGAGAADVGNSYYGRSIGTEFGPDQGPFCQKCHSTGLP